MKEPTSKGISTSSPKPGLLLIDGSSYLFRAYHALPPLTTSKGQASGAIYGVTNMIRKLLGEHPHDYFAVVFDTPSKNFRHEIYADYKANRLEMPDDLGSQITPLFNIIQAMGLPLLAIPGYEADDVIGTLAKSAEKSGIPCIISTGDKDLTQLVNPHVTLVNTMSNTVYDRQGVIAKFGLPPELIVDYLTLVGDSVDNIKGVPGVGPKTAVKWLIEYGSLENLIKQADTIKGKIGENFRNFLPDLPLAKQLVTVVTNLELNIHLNDLVRKPADENKLRTLFAELEFKNWLKEISTRPKQTQQISSSKYELITDKEIFTKWINRLQESSLFSVMITTDDLYYMNANILGIAFAIHENEAAYVPIAHFNAAHPLNKEIVFAHLKPLLENPHIAKVLHHAKFIKNIFAQHGIDLLGIQHDTMLESYVLNSTATRHDLEVLVLEHLSHQMITIEDLTGKGAKQIPLQEVSLDKVYLYAAEAAAMIMRLHQHLWNKLTKQAGQLQVYEHIELPLLSVLARMEQTGVLIDTNMLREQSAEIAKRCEILCEQAYQEAGCMFNLGSPKQLQEILYQKLKLPILEKTPTGQPSTSESVLQELAHDFALPKILLEHRSLMKLKSTYTDKLPEQINARTGRVHTSYHQAITSTGRLSSTEPNLQNIPIRTTEGRRVRQAFIASPGYKILAADYSQIELRIVAHAANDTTLIHAFQEGLDIHTHTAAEVLGITLAQVTPLQRRHAKAVNFGLMYGMSAFGLARELDISREEAAVYVQAYFNRYPGVREFMQRIRQQADREGFVETLFGRRLYVPEIHSKNPMRRRAAERAAINAPMQGTAADIIKRAMLTVDEFLQNNNISAKMIMQVHDELVFEVHESVCDEFKTTVKTLMEGAATLKVPLIIDIGIGNNWDEAH